ncbi:sigma-70 family RNA polymerase sigma factor [Aquisediminimonas profunda]|uniref:sigma-70 family RNA polymerase sigma factor n=1 Tax=Aquisediminimonas profunda TaxID=1550733 RepID=UPI001C62A3B2|nr:sigma-70 family RNA polymerase sigma factor [Aquisediminimonas profunda]
MNAQSSAEETLRPGAFVPAAKGRAGSVVDLEALLHLIGQGDRRAFRTLYDRVAGRMLSSARRILGDGDLAEDAVQEAFVRIWRSASKFDPARGVALAWVGRILRNAAFDRLPKQRDMARIEDVEIAVMPVEPPSARVGQCLKKLPGQQGKAMVLMYVHGMTHSELAAHFGAPLGTVKSWVKRGLATLRVCMGVHNEEPN